MDRRKFMIGFGGTVIGTGALLGSGAFTSFSAERSANVAVAGDSTAYLGLDAATTAGSYDAGTIDSSLVTMNGDKELQIALDGSGAEGDGVNDEAFIQLGATSENEYPDPRASTADPSGSDDSVAFVISNQFGQTINLTVEDDETTAGMLKLPYIVLDTTNDSMYESGADLTGTTVNGFEKGHEIHVVVQVDTQTESDLTETDEVSTLTLSATPTNA